MQDIDFENVVCKITFCFGCNVLMNTTSVVYFISMALRTYELIYLIINSALCVNSVYNIHMFPATSCMTSIYWFCPMSTAHRGHGSISVLENVSKLPSTEFDAFVVES